MKNSYRHEKTQKKQQMRKLFYQHIPKTGGQTLATRIASAFPIGRSSIMGPDLSYPQGVEELQRLFDSHDFIERHVNGPVLASFDDLDILLTVREPVSQIVSNYLHILREPASRLHRPAKLLSPQTFFRQYGDLLANHQTRNFIVAYRGLDPDIERLVYWATVMLECLDRVRLYVPTEAIDEFCMLWQLQTGRQMFLAEETVNVAGANAALRKELEDIVRSMPEMYSIDLLLWQIAKQRYCDYKRGVLSHVIGNPFPGNWGKVWSEGEFGIWLGRGWHPPQMTSCGLSYWAGPDRLSVIGFKRDVSHRYLLVSIIVFHGTRESDVRFVTTDGRVLSHVYRRVDKNEVVYVVDLDGLGNENHIFLLVPDVWSSAMVSHESTDTSRRSVATCKWRLSTISPLESGGESCDVEENLKNLHAGDGHGILESN